MQAYYYCRAGSSSSGAAASLCPSSRGAVGAKHPLRPLQIEDLISTHPGRLDARQSFPCSRRIFSALALKRPEPARFEPPSQTTTQPEM